MIRVRVSGPTFDTLFMVRVRIRVICGCDVMLNMSTEVRIILTFYDVVDHPPFIFHIIILISITNNKTLSVHSLSSKFKKNTNFTKMKFSRNALAFFGLSTATTTSKGSSAEDIKKAVGDGCSNTVAFQSFFATESGDTCSSCFFCNGSTLRDMFIPSLARTCVSCANEDSACNRLSIVTSFQEVWKMQFNIIHSSDMESKL